jgi:hypothetical protein
VEDDEKRTGGRLKDLREGLGQGTHHAADAGFKPLEQVKAIGLDPVFKIAAYSKCWQNYLEGQFDGLVAPMFF